MELVKEENAFRHYNAVGEVDAEITFQVEKDVLIADHTFVDPVYRGQGIGKLLVDKLANYARENQKKIHPTCSYVVNLFKKYDEYSDVKI